MPDPLKIPALPLNSEKHVPLACPRCGRAALHHSKVETFFSPGASAREVHTVSSDYGDVNVDQSMGGSPSLNGDDAIKIHFWCENCPESYDDGPFPDPIVLNIVQHRGTTLLHFEPRTYGAPKPTLEPRPSAGG